jgi:hypothetical protein
MSESHGELRTSKELGREVAEKLRQAEQQPKVPGGEQVKQIAGGNDVRPPSGLPLDALETAGKPKDNVINFPGIGETRRDEKTQRGPTQPENPKQPSLNTEEAAKSIGAEGFKRTIAEWNEEDRRNWEMFREKLKENPQAFLEELNSERRRWRKRPEGKEYSPQEEQFIAMGEIGAKLADLHVGGEERQKIFERLAENPEGTALIADVLNSIPPGDKTSMQEYMKTLQETINRLRETGGQTQEAMKQLRWWEILLYVLGAALAAGVAGAVGEDIGKAKQQAA